MRKSRTAQLMYQTAYCAIGLVAIAATLGLFDARYDSNFYVHYTNISNYFCVGIMVAELVQTARKKENSYTTVAPMLKFMGVVAILLTFLLYNGLFAWQKPLAENLTVASVLFHVVMPLLFVLDWVLFYERKQTRWYFPLSSTGILIAYVAFVYLRVWLIRGVGEVVYPYFFLDVQTLGISGVLGWMGILLGAYIATGYLLCLADHFVGRLSERNE